MQRGIHHDSTQWTAGSGRGRPPSSTLFRGLDSVRNPAACFFLKTWPLLLSAVFAWAALMKVLHPDDAVRLVDVYFEQAGMSL